MEEVSDWAQAQALKGSYVRHAVPHCINRMVYIDSSKA
jgi:hypothetical protein